MIKQTYIILLCFFIGFTIQGFSQLDTPNKGQTKGRTIGVIDAPAKEMKKPKSLEFGNDNGFKTAKKELEKKLQKEQKEKQLESKGIITPEMIAKARYNKNVEKFSYEIPMIDMDMGSFHTKSENINIISYDFSANDGDVVTIIINGKIYKKDYILSHNLVHVRIPLKIGINKLEIIAVDEGKFRPNTGHFSIYDDSKKEVTSSNWYLAKGAKVIAIIVRDKK